MRSKIKGRLALGQLFLGVLTLVSAQAELPPWVYKERQEKAPEALLIKVLSVSRRERAETNWKEIDFKVAAEVLKVERSISKLTAGATIEICYSQRRYLRPIVGPSEVPELWEGQVCRTYLTPEDKAFSPAAGGHSFETMN